MLIFFISDGGLRARRGFPFFFGRMNRPGEIKGVFVQTVRVKIGARGDIGPPMVVRGGGGYQDCTVARD